MKIKTALDPAAATGLENAQHVYITAWLAYCGYWRLTNYDITQIHENLGLLYRNYHIQ
jgi:hypothetical protein